MQKYYKLGLLLQRKFMLSKSSLNLQAFKNTRTSSSPLFLCPLFSRFISLHLRLSSCNVFNKWHSLSSEFYCIVHAHFSFFSYFIFGFYVTVRFSKWVSTSFNFCIFVLRFFSEFENLYRSFLWVEKWFLGSSWSLWTFSIIRASCLDSKKKISREKSCTIFPENDLGFLVDFQVFSKPPVLPNWFSLLSDGPKFKDLMGVGW